MPERERWRPWTPYIVLVVGLLITMVATAMVHREVTEDDRLRFEQATHLTAEAMRARIAEYGDILRALSGLYHVDEQVSVEDFQTFLGDSGLGRHPALRAVSYVEVVPRHMRKELEAAMRSSDVEDFQVWPPGGRDPHAVAVRVHPREGNRAALGFDLTTSPPRRRALRRACRTGRAAISDPIELATGDRSTGMLLALPVYGVDGATGCDAVRGYLVAVVAQPAFFEQIHRRLPERRIEFAVYGGESPDAPLLYRSSDGTAPEAVRFQAKRSLDLAGRRWVMGAWPGPAFDDLSPRGLVPFVLVAGVIISLALFGLVWSESRARAHAQAVAHELARSEEALARANQAKDEFLAMLGHELRNPLSAVKIALGILRDAEIDDPDARAAIDVAERQMRHQSRLVDDLLDVSRVSRGKIVLSPQRVDLRDVVADAVAGMQGPAEAAGHGITVARSSEAILVDVDSTRMEQVISNLLSNAIKYSPEDGRVHVVVEREGGEAVVRVRDRGIGLDPASLERIFDLFAQEHASVARSEGGLGIGLTLVKRLVELHGGRVAARSEGLGEGSEFEVRVPVAAGTPPHRTTPFEPEPPAALRILLIEDNDDARTLLRSLLEKQGHRVETASDGEAGIQSAMEDPPDVALVDIGLPRMDGYEVARRLRERWGDRISLVAVTGYGQPSDIRRSEEAGFDHHLVKPVDPSKLADVLARMGPGGGVSSRSASDRG